MRITPFNLHQNIAFDNAISSIQYLHQLGSKIQDIISVLNNLETDYENYTDKKVEELKAFLLEKDEQLKDLVKEWIANLNSSLTDSIDEGVAHSKSYTDAKTNDLKEELASLNESMLDITTKLDLKVDARFNECNKLITDFRLEIYDMLNNFDNFKCYSPVTGEFEAIKDILYEITNLFLKRHSFNYSTLYSICNKGNEQKALAYKFDNNTVWYLDEQKFTIIESLADLVYLRPIFKAGTVTTVLRIVNGVVSNITDKCDIINDSVKIPVSELKVTHDEYEKTNVCNIRVVTNAGFNEMTLFTFYDNYVCTYDTLQYYASLSSRNVTYEDINLYGINALYNIIYTSKLSNSIQLINLDKYITLVSNYFEI